MAITICKYEAAGNAYIVTNLEFKNFQPELATKLCHPVFGIGGDGVVNWQKSENGFKVLIFNPDGSLAEKSGNGLRILAAHLFNNIVPNHSKINLKTGVGNVAASKDQNGKIVLEMGQVVSLFEQEPLAISSIFPHGIRLELENTSISGYPVSIGNPHFVIVTDSIGSNKVKELGPQIENHSLFPNRVNVQFVTPTGRSSARAHIWERGAGYTLSSGSSSCAIFAVLHQLGFCDEELSVVTNGGKLHVRRDASATLWLRGPVKKVAEGVFLG